MAPIWTNEHAASLRKNTLKKSERCTEKAKQTTHLSCRTRTRSSTDDALHEDQMRITAEPDGECSVLLRGILMDEQLRDKMKRNKCSYESFICLASQHLMFLVCEDNLGNHFLMQWSWNITFDEYFFKIRKVFNVTQWKDHKLWKGLILCTDFLILNISFCLVLPYNDVSAILNARGRSPSSFLITIFKALLYKVIPVLSGKNN